MPTKTTPWAITGVTYLVARAGEVIAICKNRHCAGPPALPLYCHEDEACFCAPRGTDAEVGRRFAATRPNAEGCVVDKAAPSRDDYAGTCPRARCAAHLD